MRARLPALLALLALAPTLGAAELPKLPCGVIDKFEILEPTAEAAPNLVWQEAFFGERPTLAEDERFAVVRIDLAEGRSVGKHDYELGGTPCLAMSVGTEPYRPDRWEVKRGTAPMPMVGLLFKIVAPDDSGSVEFSFRYSVPSISATEASPILRWGAEPEPVVPEGEGEVEGEAGAPPEDVMVADAEGEGEADAEGEGAPDAEGEGEAAAVAAAEPADGDAAAGDDAPGEGAGDAPEVAAAAPAEKPEPEPEKKPEPKPEKKPEPKPEKKPAGGGGRFSDW